MPGVTYTIDFAAAIARLEDGTKRGAKAVRQMADEIESATNFAKSAVLALAGALGVHAFKDWVAGAAEAADASAKVGDRFGITTEKAIGLQHAARLAGASNETLTSSLRTVQFQATQAAMGLTESQRAFQLLNINVADFLRMPADEQLRTIIDRLEKTENVTVRNAAAQQLLGRGAGEMMALVADGAGAIDEATKKTQAWGLAISRVDAAKLEMANDAMTDAKMAAQGAATTIAVALAPVVKLVADRFSDAAAESHGFRDEVEVGMQRAVQAVGSAIWFTERLGFAWEGLKYLAALAINGIIQALASLDRAYTDTMNSLADSWIGKRLGMQSREYSATLQEMAEVSQNRLGEIKDELDKFALSALTLEQWQAKIKAVFSQAKAQIQREAEDIARRRAEFMKGGEAPTLITDKPDKDKDKYQEDLLKKVEAIRQGNLSEMELLEEQLQAKQDTLDAARAFNLITEEEYQAQLTAVAFRYNAQRTVIEQKSQQQIRSMQFATFNYAADLFQALAGESKAAALVALAIQKGLAIASVIVNTEGAIARGYLELGPFAGAAFEARMRTLEAIQIGLIAATGLVQASQVGSGGASSGTAANPQIVQPVSGSAIGPAQQAPTQTTIIHLPPGFDKKQLFSGEVMFDLLKSMEEATRMGGRVIVQ